MYSLRVLVNPSMHDDELPYIYGQKKQRKRLYYYCNKSFSFIMLPGISAKGPDQAFKEGQMSQNKKKKGRA